MNKKQIKAALAVTNQEWLACKLRKTIEGSLVFIAEESGDTVFIHGSNTYSISDSPLKKHFIVNAFIGPRGGLKITTY